MERDKEAYWLVQLSQTFDFAPETFVLAISIMDRVSTLVKVSILDLWHFLLCIESILKPKPAYN